MGPKKEAHAPACPACGKHRSYVLYSRSHPFYSAVSRRRRCLECFYTWTTDELPALEKPPTRPEESPDQ